jgi:hypothetical protein
LIVRRRRAWLAFTAAALVVAVAVVLIVNHDGIPRYQRPIPAERSDTALAPWIPRKSRPPASSDYLRPFVTDVAPNGRYFIDQYGAPLLIRGDSPWAMLFDLSPDQVDRYLVARTKLGVNAVLVSLIGARANGGPSDSGTTFDGLRPFVGGDVNRLSAPYWARVHDYLAKAATLGITVFLYGIDSWSLGRAFAPRNLEQCTTFGTLMHAELSDLPNVVWLAGGDYEAGSDATGSDPDRCINQMMRGLRQAGDHRLFSIQLNGVLTTSAAYWNARVDWCFAYTYAPSYRQILEAYATRPVRPVLLGEANYEGENNIPDSPPTTNETLRRQVLWSLTSGAAGDFYGSADWQFLPGWEDRLDRPGLNEVSTLNLLVRRLQWWELRPDFQSQFLLSGRGAVADSGSMVDVLDNAYATAAISADNTVAMVYVPTARTITVDVDRLAEGTHAFWIDPTDGGSRSVALARTFTSPGLNRDGDEDWLLLFSHTAP